MTPFQLPPLQLPTLKCTQGTVNFFMYAYAAIQASQLLLRGTLHSTFCTEIAQNRFSHLKTSTAEGPHDATEINADTEWCRTTGSASIPSSSVSRLVDSGRS